MAGTRVGGIRSRAVLTVVAMATIASIWSVRAQAATYAPNKLGDHAPGGCTHSDCTLREAITKANNHAGPDAIVLRGGKTYNLSRLNSSGDEDANATGDLDVLGPVALKSSNRKLATVNANDIDRVFEVGPGSAVNATFRRLLLRNGNTEAGGGDGGGIEAIKGGVLKLIKSKIVSNRAEYGGAINAVQGTLRLTRSVIANNRAFNGYGGGIYDDGPAPYELVWISRSRIVGNTASQGVGGLESYNDTTITKSTIANNRAENERVGGIRFGEGVLRVTSSTISGNTAALDYGGVYNQDHAVFVNDTITKNRAGGAASGLFAGGVGVTDLNAVTVARNSAGTDGGGIYVDDAATMNAENSLIGLNTASGLGPDCFADGDFVSGGHNLVGDPAGTQDCALGFTQPGDISNINPKIAQLADNGGPTKTIALKKGSKAINHAGQDAPKRDQRGVKRKNADIGSYERR